MGYNTALIERGNVPSTSAVIPTLLLIVHRDERKGMKRVRVEPMLDIFLLAPVVKHTQIYSY